MKLGPNWEFKSDKRQWLSNWHINESQRINKKVWVLAALMSRWALETVISIKTKQNKKLPCSFILAFPNLFTRTLSFAYLTNLSPSCTNYKVITQRANLSCPALHFPVSTPLRPARPNLLAEQPRLSPLASSPRPVAPPPIAIHMLSKKLVITASVQGWKGITEQSHSLFNPPLFSQRVKVCA